MPHRYMLPENTLKPFLERDQFDRLAHIWGNTQKLVHYERQKSRDPNVVKMVRTTHYTSVLQLLRGVKRDDYQVTLTLRGAAEIITLTFAVQMGTVEPLGEATDVPTDTHFSLLSQLVGHFPTIELLIDEAGALHMEAGNELTNMLGEQIGGMLDEHGLDEYIWSMMLFPTAETFSTLRLSIRVVREKDRETL